MPHLSTVVPFGFDELPTQRLLTLYRELGCQTAQFYRNAARPADLATYRRIAEDAGLPFDSIHGVFGADIDPSSLDEAHRRASVLIYEREAEVALTLGGPMVVVHPAPVVPENSVVDAARLTSLRRSIAELARIGESAGVTFLIENLPPACLCPASGPALAELLREAAHPRVRMCFDTGHAAMTGVAHEELEVALHAVSLVHLSDNDGRRDQHLVPGKGVCDWPHLKGLFERLHPGCPLTLEIFPSVAELEELVQDRESLSLLI